MSLFLVKAGFGEADLSSTLIDSNATIFAWVTLLHAHGIFDMRMP